MLVRQVSRVDQTLGSDGIEGLFDRELTGHNGFREQRGLQEIQAGVVDVESERPRLEKAIAETEKLLAASEEKLGNESFRERAPEAVVAKEQAKRDEFAARVEKLRAQLAELG